jgi:hypothetical protein
MSEAQSESVAYYYQDFDFEVRFAGDVGGANLVWTTD